MLGYVLIGVLLLGGVILVRPLLGQKSGRARIRAALRRHLLPSSLVVAAMALIIRWGGAHWLELLEIGILGPASVIGLLAMAWQLRRGRRFGAALVDVRRDPIRRVFRICGVVLAVSGALILTGLIADGKLDAPSFVRVLFVVTTALFFISKGRSTTELYENGIVRLEGALPWGAVSAYSWQERGNIAVLKLRLREPWRFQRELAIRIPVEEQPRLQALLLTRLPYLGTGVPENETRAPLT